MLDGKETRRQLMPGTETQIPIHAIDNCDRQPEFITAYEKSRQKMAFRHIGVKIEVVITTDVNKAYDEILN